MASAGIMMYLKDVGYKGEKSEADLRSQTWTVGRVVMLLRGGWGDGAKEEWVSVGR